MIRRFAASFAILPLLAFGFQSQQNTVKGQGQLAGANVDFGTIYSLKSGFNFTILSAKYTLEPIDVSGPLCAETNSKLLVLEFAIKNAKPDDNFFATDDLIVAVDTAGKLFPANAWRLESTGAEGPDFMLRPGQGLGQKELKNPLRVAIRVDAKSVINKIMVNLGRVNTSEQVIRYMLVEPPKPGVEPKPKNFASPLPDYVRDPSDPYGARALDLGKAAIGGFVPSGPFNLRLDGVAEAPDAKYDGEPAEEGKKFVVATFTVQSLITEERSMFEVEGDDDPLYKITDADGERYRPRGYRKAKADEEPEHTFRKGDQYAFRMFFLLPKDAKARKLVFGTAASRKWSLDLN